MHLRTCNVCGVILPCACRSRQSEGYGPEWSRRRTAFLAKHPLCADCGEPATDADHYPTTRRVLLAQGVADPDADAYLVPRCAAHHRSRSARQGHDRRITREVA